MHGRQPVLPIEAALCPPTLSYSSADDYKEETKQRLQEAFTLVKSNSQKAQQRQKEYHDRNSSNVEFSEGDKVWLFTPATTPGLSPKLSHNWHGPFKILKKLSEVTYKLQDQNNDAKTQTTHVDRMKPYINPCDPPDHDYFPDNEEEWEKDPIRYHGSIVKVLDIMRSHNKSN